MKFIVGAFIIWLFTLDPLQLLGLIFGLLAIAFLLSVGMVIEWSYKRLNKYFSKEAGATE